MLTSKSTLQVVFLAQGRVAFHGAPNEAITFFAKCGYMLPDHTNPADHFADVLTLLISVVRLISDHTDILQVLAIWPDRAEECRKRTNAICDEVGLSSTYSP